MARPRFDRIGADKREAILQAAAREFVANGYKAASTNRILDDAGLSKGAFYYYFDDKADLAATVLIWAMREVLDIFERVAEFHDRESFWSALRGLLDESLAQLVRSPLSHELVSLLGVAMVNDKELAARVMAMPEVAAASVAGVGLWRRGQEVGAVRTDLPAEVVVALVQAAKESLIRAYFPKDRAPTVEELERIGALQFDLYRRISAPAEEGTR